MKKGLKMCS